MKFYKLPLSIGLFFALLMIILLGIYSLDALRSFYVYKEKVNPNIELTIDRFHFFFRSKIKKEYINIMTHRALSDEESPLKTFHITVNQQDIYSLNENLPTSGKDHYIDAYMKVSDDEKIRKVKLRYRGDNSFHWLYEQKSLRVKLSKNELYNMEKEFNLINHPNLTFHRDIINYKLARKLGMMTPDYFPVRVFINGKFMGVYIYLSQVNESLLRKHKIMPGSIYSGDGATVNKFGISNLWDNEKLWKKKAARNAEQKRNREDIKFFVEIPNEKDEKKFYLNFKKYFNIENIYNFIAIDRLVSAGHHDYHHNHKIYFDPYKGMFEQIEWDVRGWLKSNKKDYALNPLLIKLKKNPILDTEIDRKVYNLIENGIEESFSIWLDNIYKQVKVDLERDVFKDTSLLNKNLSNKIISIPFTNQEYFNSILNDKEFLAKRIKVLDEIYNSVNIKFNVSNIEGNKYKLNIMINGGSAAKVIFSNFTTITKVAGMPLDGNSTLLYPGRKLVKDVLKTNIRLFGTDDIANVPQYYEYIITTNDIKNFTNKIKFINYITSKEIRASNSLFKINYDKEIIHPWDFIDKIESLVNLSGNIDLHETLVFDSHVTVNIAPGTVFNMAENTSIYFYGKVLAIGTKEKPISFTSKDSTKSWGLIAVQGKATTGSRFEYCEFENGSIDTRNLIQYTAPFNIHDTDWFEVINCKIGKNLVGDDSMHIAYAKGIVDSCEFVNARSDGLDIDISDVNITNNIFYNSGNDGLDIMTTTMNASNNVFIDMGDKGISIGEWSDANITESFFLRTVIGLEIKDKSTVKANNLVFVDSIEKAINLYNKNKRYDEGGFLDANKMYLLGNKTVSVDKYSRIIIKNPEKDLSDFEKFQWHKNLNSTQYKNFVDEVELKYVK